MMSIQQNYYLPTAPIPQTIHKVNYNMTTFTDNYSLRNNYLWNYHMPLLLPELLHYLYNRDQLQLPAQGNYYHPLQEYPVLRIHTTHHDKPHSTSSIQRPTSSWNLNSVNYRAQVTTFANTVELMNNNGFHHYCQSMFCTSVERYYKDLLTEGPCQTTCFTSCICVACMFTTAGLELTTSHE